MSIFVNEQTRVVVQGITGKEGGRVAREMSLYGTKVVAGVTPGKGNTNTDDGIPIFDSVAYVRTRFPEINTSLIVVPARFAYDATLEAIENRIPLIDILTEGIPVLEVARLLEQAKQAKVRIVGPSSIGIISPSRAKVGSIGSGGLDTAIFTRGPIGVMSKSGGMTAELSRILTEHGLGQSTVVGVGGDILIGSDFLSVALEFQSDPETFAIVVFGEVGGMHELLLADAIQKKQITKPVIALIAGVFAQGLPEGTSLGHAGAIVSGGRDSATGKMEALKDAGALIAHTPEEIPLLVRKALPLSI